MKEGFKGNPQIAALLSRTAYTDSSGNMNTSSDVKIETKNLIKCADRHFNGNGSLCLYHPIFD